MAPLPALRPHGLDRRQPAECRTTAPDYLWGWLVHRRGESRDASSRNKRIRPRPGSAAGYLSRPLAPDWAAFPLGGFSAPFCLASGLSATDDVSPIQQQFFFFGQQVQCRIDAGAETVSPTVLECQPRPGLRGPGRAERR